MKRLLNYVKPHRITVLVSLVLVLILIGTQLMSPIVIGEAIDQYISGYQKPFVESTDSNVKTVLYKGRLLTREFDLQSAGEMDQLVLHKNHYYMFHLKNLDESKILTKEDFVLKKQSRKIGVFTKAKKEEATRIASSRIIWVVNHRSHLIGGICWNEPIRNCHRYTLSNADRV